MPNATVSLAAQRYMLETCEGGWVELRRMPYGKKLDRAEQATEQSMRGKQGATSEEDVEMMLRLLQRRVAEIEFRECIVDHNLDDGGDPDAEPPVPPKKLDFALPATLDVLDPRIGEEISTLIEGMNNYERDMTKPGN